MKIRPVSVAVVVKDRKKSARWYQEKLGFKQLADDDEHWTVVGYPKKGMQLHLCEAEDGQGPSKAETDTGILLTVDSDFAKAAAKLQKRGVAFAQPPTERPWGWVSKIRDPDGNVLWLVPEE